MATLENSLFITLTESHLKSFIYDAEVHIENYVIFRTDRAKERRKGGVINYIREDVAPDATILKSISNEYCELLLIYIKSQKLIVGTMYRPPNCPKLKFIEPLSIISEELKKLDQPSPTILLTGDFNLPIINWQANTVTGGCIDTQSQASKLLDLASEHCLTQCIDVSTRGKNTLDLIFTNNEELIHSIKVTDTALSDHKLILIKSNMFIKKQTNSPPKIISGETSLKDRAGYFNPKFIYF